MVESPAGRPVTILSSPLVAKKRIALVRTAPANTHTLAFGQAALASRQYADLDDKALALALGAPKDERLISARAEGGRAARSGEVVKVR